MSMSEFDEQLHNGGNNPFPLSTNGSVIPDDFSVDDMAFVEELNTLFSPSNEELPPYFVQTLLETEDPRFTPIEHGLEYKTAAHVFRRLKLRRRLFYSHRFPFVSLLDGIGRIAIRRSLLAMSAALMLIMILTVAFTGQSFALGMAMLLQGGHAGVYPVTHYPTTMIPFRKYYGDASQPERLSLLKTQQLLHFPMYSPTALPDNYELNAIYLYQEPSKSWVDGPILELEYNNSLIGDAAPGTGQIFISEFKPQGDVLQLVQSGATHSISIDQNGHARAIYVDGQWASSSYGRAVPQWVYGKRSELIYQQGDVVFWIVGDQRDGIKESQLLAIANSLQVVNIGRIAHSTSDMGYMARMVKSLPGPFTSDVLVIFPEDSGDGPYLSYIGSSSTNSQKPAHKSFSH